MTYDKLPKIIKYLKDEKKATPSAIASHINSDIRTTNKMLSSLSDLKLVQHQSFKVGQNNYSSYSLAKKKSKFYGG
jgi:Mn-dependent DtxR family transcriptional regulator